MIVIFAGAGASKAVNPEQYPTTVEFFERLPSNLKGDEVFRAAVQYIQEHNEEGHIVDIEQILWLINDLRDFNLSIRDVSKVPGWFITGGYFATLSGHQKTALNFLGGSADTINKKIEALSSHINTVVYDLYAESPTKEELKDNWLSLLEPLTKNDRLEIATTNYDLVIEEAVFQSSFPISLGRTSGIQQFLNTSAWDLKTFEDPKKQGLLTKLHGSVDWIRRGQRIQVGFPSFQGQHDKHAIIYPGFKGTPTDPLFQRLHEYFHVSLSKVDVVIFIGYAFRDEYINDILRRHLNTSAEVLILNPAPLPDNPIPEGRFKHIKEYFDRKGVELLLRHSVLLKAIAARG